MKSLQNFDIFLIFFDMSVTEYIFLHANLEGNLLQKVRGHMQIVH